MLFNAYIFWLIAWFVVLIYTCKGSGDRDREAESYSSADSLSLFYTQSKANDKSKETHDYILAYTSC